MNLNYFVRWLGRVLVESDPSRPAGHLHWALGCVFFDSSTLYFFLVDLLRQCWSNQGLHLRLWFSLRLFLRLRLLGDTLVDSLHQRLSYESRLCLWLRLIVIIGDRAVINELRLRALLGDVRVYLLRQSLSHQGLNLWLRFIHRLFLRLRLLACLGDLLCQSRPYQGGRFWFLFFYSLQLWLRFIWCVQLPIVLLIVLILLILFNSAWQRDLCFFSIFLL